MSAQYRPYRDEESLENEQINWAEQEPGTVEIYEKTDDSRGANKNLVVGAIGIALLAAMLGLVIGYFAHSQHAECIPSMSVALHSVFDEDPTIRSRLNRLISAENLKNYIKRFSSIPRVAGSDADQTIAKEIYNLWQDEGLDRVQMAKYKVLLSYPNASMPNKVEVINVNTSNTVYTATIDSSIGAGGILPPFGAYSPAGKVEGDLVYVNYGHFSDFTYVHDVLQIDLTGKILIARQLDVSSSNLLLLANAFGAAGILLYPDPKDFNPPLLQQVPFPHSWWLPKNAARTESLLINGLGDPLTPGYPATDYAFRLPKHETLLPTIPVQPISYSVAYNLLKDLNGSKVQSSFQGGFNFSYTVGPGFKDSHLKVHLEVNNYMANKTIQNVVGYLKGNVEPDRYIIIGSHRDSWAYGAVDGAAGTAALIEISRSFLRLLKEGFRPRRTILFCSWDAEEYGSLGSTEWLEENYKVLHGRAVAYINADILVIGNSSISASASPLLYHAIFNATKEVPNPMDAIPTDGPSPSVYDVWMHTFPAERNASSLLFPDQSHGDSTFLDYDLVSNKVPLEKVGLLQNYVRSAMQKVRPRVRSLDSHSTYFPFFVRSGIPVAELTFVHDIQPSPISYPLHHTEYDIFKLIERTIDPTFQYHRAVTAVLAELLRDLADSLFLPFNLLDYAQVLRDFHFSLKLNADHLMKSQGIDLGLLDAAIIDFTSSALSFHSRQEKYDRRDPMEIRKINDQLILLERAFLESGGIPQNSLKKHIVLSPSNSKAVMDETFPGLMDGFAAIMHSEGTDASTNWDIIRMHYSVLVLTIRSAADCIKDI